MNASIEIVGTGPTFEKIVEHIVAHAHEWRDLYDLTITSVGAKDLSHPTEAANVSTADFLIHVRAPQMQA